MHQTSVVHVVGDHHHIPIPIQVPMVHNLIQIRIRGDHVRNVDGAGGKANVDQLLPLLLMLLLLPVLLMLLLLPVLLLLLLVRRMSSK
jgi:hypothetical protein